jgi:hypothetical protein
VAIELFDVELSELGELVTVTCSPLVAEKVEKLMGIEVSALELGIELVCAVVIVFVLVHVMVELLELGLSGTAKVVAGPDL